MFDGGRLLRVLGPPDRPWVVGIEPEGSRWRIEAWGAGPHEARAAVRRLFSLDHPLEEFYRLVRREPALRGTETRFRGLRVPCDANVYEALIHSILGQQLSVRAVNHLKQRLLDRTSAFVTADGFDVPCAPSPEKIRSLGPDGMRELGISRAKAHAISALAADPSHLGTPCPRLARMPVRAAIDALTELPGVGRWTAENALLRGVGRADIFVAGDLGLRVALEKYGGVLRSAPESVARTWGARWYPGWGSYATLYLWRKLVAERTNDAAG